MKRMKGHEGFKAFFFMIFMSFMGKIFLPKKQEDSWEVTKVVTKFKSSQSQRTADETMPIFETLIFLERPKP